MALAEQGFDVGITYHQDEEGAMGTAEECRAAGATAQVRQQDLDAPPTGTSGRMLLRAAEVNRRVDS